MTLRLQKWFMMTQRPGCLLFVPPDPDLDFCLLPSFSALYCASEVMTSFNWLLCLLALAGLGLANGGNGYDSRERRKVIAFLLPALSMESQQAVSLPKGLDPSSSPLEVALCLRFQKPLPPLYYPLQFLTSCPHLCKWSPYKTPFNYSVKCTFCACWGPDWYNPSAQFTDNTNLDLHHIWQNSMH